MVKELGGAGVADGRLFAKDGSYCGVSWYKNHADHMLLDPLLHTSIEGKSI